MVCLRVWFVYGGWSGLHVVGWDWLVNVLVVTLVRRASSYKAMTQSRAWPMEHTSVQVLNEQNIHLPVSLHPNRGITKLNIYRYMYFQKLFSLIPYKKITVSGHKRKHKCTMNSILWQSSLSNKQEYPGIDSWQYQWSKKYSILPNWGKWKSENRPPLSW